MITTPAGMMTSYVSADMANSLSVVRYAVVASFDENRCMTSDFSYEFVGDYAHSSHLIQIMRKLNDMGLDLISITVDSIRSI